MNIEVEIRSFISREKYEELLAFFSKNAEISGEEDQTTFYYDSPQGLRIQKTNYHSKIWLKKGNMHAACREEIELKLKTHQFAELEKLFAALNFNVEIKWFRKRHSFRWDGIKVMLDSTKGYGYIVEFEKMASNLTKDVFLKQLKEKFEQLEIPLTSKGEFDKKFEHYKQNWRNLV